MAGRNNAANPSVMSTLKQAASGTLFFMSLAMAGYIGCLLFMPFVLLIQFVMPRFGRYVVDFFVGSFLTFAVGLYEHVLGVKVSVVGDVGKLRVCSNRLIIMNHRTRLDWLFSFSIQSRFGSLLKYKILLKRGLNHIPGAGWAMQAACFVFLHRKWTLDRGWIKTLLLHYRGLMYTPQFLLFPEGTNLCEITRRWEKEYAEKNNITLPGYEYVLYPRTTGFVYIVRKLEKLQMLEQLADVTVMYPKNIVERETDIIFKGAPKEIVFHVKVFEREDLPVGDKRKLEEWLHQRWTIKEQFLKDFYENGKKISNGRTSNQNVPFWRQVSAICFWYINMAFFFIIVIYQPGTVWYFALMTVVFTLISSYIGFEKFFL